MAVLYRFFMRFPWTAHKLQHLPRERKINVFLFVHAQSQSELQHATPQRYIRPRAKQIRKHSLGTFAQGVGNCLRTSAASDQILQNNGFHATLE